MHWIPSPTDGTGCPPRRKASGGLLQGWRLQLIGPLLHQLQPQALAASQLPKRYAQIAAAEGFQTLQQAARYGVLLLPSQRRSCKPRRRQLVCSFTRPAPAAQAHHIGHQTEHVQAASCIAFSKSMLVLQRPHHPGF